MAHCQLCRILHTVNIYASNSRFNLRTRMCLARVYAPSFSQASSSRISTSNYLVLTQLLSRHVRRHGSMSLIRSRAKSDYAALDARNARFLGMTMRIGIRAMYTFRSCACIPKWLRSRGVVLGPAGVVLSASCSCTGSSNGCICTDLRRSSVSIMCVEAG